jgi:nucleoside-diphosphate-sugar epimerase
MKLGELNFSSKKAYAWSILDGDSIFMTGGTGFFGTALLYSLLKVKSQKKVNINITILTRNILSFSINHPKLFESKFIHCIQGDVTDFTFPDKKYSKILHFATTTANETFNGESQLKKYKTLVNGTERVMQFAEICGAKKVLFTSSGVVYGKTITGEVKETDAGAPITIDPTSALGHGKRSAEFIVAYYSEKYNIDYVIARCFSFIGPELPRNIHYAIGNFIYDAKNKDTITIKGDGSPIRSYLDIDDLIIWLLVLIGNECKYKIYNVGSDQVISILNLAKKIKSLLSPNIKINIIGSSKGSKDNFNRNVYAPNISRARDEHSLDVWTDLDESINKIK